MSETINIKITNDDGWVEIPYTGFITASKSVEFLASDEVPSNTLIGHHMKTFGNSDFTDSDSTLYARGEATIIITPGGAFNPNGQPAPAGIYSGLRAMTTQSYIEANSKNGTQHELSVFLENLAGSGVNETLVVTGSLPIVLKERKCSYTGEGAFLEICEGATYSDIGDEITIYNVNKINPVTPETKVYSGATITDDGDCVFTPEYLIGNNSNQGNGGQQNIVSERILNPNTVYLLKATSLDSATEAVWLFDAFYEGELDLPLE